MSLDLFFQYLFAGITYGSIYAIVAIGFNIIYNTTGIINFAQGEFVMLGGMISISLMQFMPLGYAIAAAVLITMVIGAAIEMLFIRWLESPSVLRMIIITIGISILLRESGPARLGRIHPQSALFLRQRDHHLFPGQRPHFAPGGLGDRCLFGDDGGPEPLFQVHAGWPGDAGLRRQPDGGLALRHQHP